MSVFFSSSSSPIHPSIHLQKKVRLSGREIQLDGITSFFFFKAEGQWVRAGPHRTYISIPTAGRCYLLPNKITKSRQKKNIRGIRTGIYYYFLFFLNLITLIENISTYFAIE